MDRADTTMTTRPAAAGPRPGEAGARPELRPGPPWAMDEMIAIEPELAGAIVADSAAAAELALAILDALAGKQTVTLVGSGTSEHAAIVLAALLADSVPTAPPGSFVAREAFEATLDPWPGLCIAVSHEGATPSTAEALAAARSVGASTAVITAVPDDAVGRSAERAFVTPTIDRSWCHTVGYLSPLAAGAAIAAALQDRAVDPGAVERGLRATLELARAEAPGVAALVGRAARVVPVGSGVDEAAAWELALKLEEGAQLPAAARETETFLHGHLAAIDGSAALVVIVADPRATDRRTVRAAQGARAAAVLGARVGAILSPAAAARWGGTATDAGRLVLPEPAVGAGGAGALAAHVLATAIALQTLALAVVDERGTNPDLIRREDERHQRAADVAKEPLPD